MGSFSIWHWLVVGIVLLLLFGKGRFSEMMGDVAKGIKSFKKGMTEDEEAAQAAEQRRISEGRPPEPQVIPPQPGDITPEPTAADRSATGTDGAQR